MVFCTLYCWKFDGRSGERSNWQGRLQAIRWLGWTQESAGGLATFLRRRNRRPPKIKRFIDLTTGGADWVEPGVYVRASGRQTNDWHGKSPISSCWSNRLAGNIRCARVAAPVWTLLQTNVDLSWEGLRACLECFKLLALFGIQDLLNKRVQQRQGPNSGKGESGMTAKKRKKGRTSKAHWRRVKPRAVSAGRVYLGMKRPWQQA